MNEKTCARCEKFSVKDHPAEAAQGKGRCSVAWEKEIEPFMRWDERACVLFGRARNISARENWIRQQEGK